MEMEEDTPVRGSRVLSDPEKGRRGWGSPVRRCPLKGVAVDETGEDKR